MNIHYWCYQCGNIQYYDTCCEFCNSDDFLIEVLEESEDE